MNLRDMNKDMLIKIIETMGEKNKKENNLLRSQINKLEEALTKFDIVECEMCKKFIDDNDEHDCPKRNCYCYYCGVEFEEKVPCDNCYCVWCDKCGKEYHRCYS